MACSDLTTGRGARLGWGAVAVVVLLALAAPVCQARDLAQDVGQPMAPDTSQGIESSPNTVEGAVGLVLKYAPAFPGSSDVSLRATPAGFVRWGRYTLTGAGGSGRVSGVLAAAAMGAGVSPRRAG